jgi:hypothetical protein
MEAIYRLNANEIDSGFMKSIKELFRGHEVIITVTTHIDETMYLAMSKSNLEHLQQSMTEEPSVRFTLDEFKKFVEDTKNGK